MSQQQNILVNVWDVIASIHNDTKKHVNRMGRFINYLIRSGEWRDIFTVVHIKWVDIFEPQVFGFFI